MFNCYDSCAKQLITSDKQQNLKVRELTEVANMSAKIPYEKTCFSNWFYLIRIGSTAKLKCNIGNKKQLLIIIFSISGNIEYRRDEIH